MNRYKQLEQATQHRESAERVREKLREHYGSSGYPVEWARRKISKARRFERNIAKLQEGKPLGYVGAYGAAFNRTFNRRAMPDRVKANSSELTARRVLRDRRMRNRVRQSFRGDKYGLFYSLHRLLRFV
ncbi:hypothetical protein RU58_00015 [Achromobacter phage phiAxp-1]|uniref:hypothetical protein n=1 Tax=Achromobacter phage phiAxp-1 TaxID=1610509 RepID=UPI0006561B1B|nr:hypothetical protein RU58_00015 [Achromobacter phage phiAxp-1]AKJ71404.1 hypothetical protein RU58_00015 [Achromobacter phage phiAxp-1]QDH84386.1 hypothetical protein Axy18_015 [Achromobacter phage vB_AxyS_19-32_Axy18]